MELPDTKGTNERRATAVAVPSANDEDTNRAGLKTMTIDEEKAVLVASTTTTMTTTTISTDIPRCLFAMVVMPFLLIQAVKKLGLLPQQQLGCGRRINDDIEIDDDTLQFIEKQNKVEAQLYKREAAAARRASYVRGLVEIINVTLPCVMATAVWGGYDDDDASSSTTTSSSASSCFWIRVMVTAVLGAATFLLVQYPTAYCAVGLPVLWVAFVRALWLEFEKAMTVAGTAAAAAASTATTGITCRSLLVPSWSPFFIEGWAVMAKFVAVVATVVDDNDISNDNADDDTNTARTVIPMILLPPLLQLAVVVDLLWHVSVPIIIIAAYWKLLSRHISWREWRSTLTSWIVATTTTTTTTVRRRTEAHGEEQR